MMPTKELAGASHDDASAPAGPASPRPTWRPSCELRSRVAASGHLAGGSGNPRPVIIDERGAAGEAIENATADDPAVAIHLDRALVKLSRADHCRIGPNQHQYLEEAADHLTAAGQIALAKQVEEVVVDGFGGDLRGVEDAVRELLGGE